MKKLHTREWIGVAVAVVAGVAIFYGSTIWHMFGADKAADAIPANPLSSQRTVAPEKQVPNTSTIEGLQIYDLEVGTGDEAVIGKTAVAHYVGYLENGTVFDSSLKRNLPFEFAIGGGRVIRGWDLGIVGMKEGGVRRLVITPELGYGNQALGPIPANSTLIFEIQLLEVK